MKESKKTNFKLKNILRLVLLVICGLIVGVNVYLANANNLVGNQLPMPFGYGAATVLSGSMEREFSEGDLIVVSEAENYKVDDIVVFSSGSSLVVHRIIEMDGDKVVTQGDANNVADDPIEVSAIKGKVLFHIDKAGTVVSFFKTPVGTILIIALAIALIEIPRINDKKKYDEEKQKILEEIENLKKQ